MTGDVGARHRAREHRGRERRRHGRQRAHQAQEGSQCARERGQEGGGHRVRPGLVAAAIIASMRSCAALTLAWHADSRATLT